MSATSVRSPTEFQTRLERYLFERSEEWRAVRVGEKEVSEQAEIVRRFADLFSREQLDALQEAEELGPGDDRELLYRLRKTCERADLLAARRARGRARKPAAGRTRDFQGEEMPLRNAQAKLAVLTAYADREELGQIQADASAEFNDDRLELSARQRSLRRTTRAIADAVERNEEEKDISLRELSRALKAASDDSTQSYGVLRDSWFTSCSARSARTIPSSYHTAYMRRLSPLESTYTKDRATEICLRRSTRSGSTSPHDRTSSSTSTIGRRSRRAPA